MGSYDHLEQVSTQKDHCTWFLLLWSLCVAVMSSLPPPLLSPPLPSPPLPPSLRTLCRPSWQDSLLPPCVDGTRLHLLPSSDWCHETWAHLTDSHIFLWLHRCSRVTGGLRWQQRQCDVSSQSHHQCLSLPQVAILLLLANWLVHFLWRRGNNPDNSAIPYLTAAGDLLGTGLLAVTWLVLWSIGDRDNDVGE